jgi:hypothetical protein
MSSELKLRNGDRVRLKIVTVAGVDASGFTLSEQDREGYIEFEMVEEIIYRKETPEEELERLRAELASAPRKIEWSGGECPVADNTNVVVWFRSQDEEVDTQNSDDLDWSHTNDPRDIIAYMELPE